MTTTDVLYLAFITALLLCDHFVLWPMFLRRSQTDPGRTRIRIWLSTMTILWTLVAALVALWLFEARSWRDLRLVMPHGWRLWISIALVIAVVITNARTALRIARSGPRRRIKIVNPHAELMAPHTGSELCWWVALSLSAGFCEELIFRGYLIWAFQPWFGLWGAAVFSVIVFSAAHAYEGVKGVLAVAVVGTLLTLLVLISGSLVPAMILHALIDIGQGVITWLAFSKMQDETTGKLNGAGAPPA